MCVMKSGQIRLSCAVRARGECAKPAVFWLLLATSLLLFSFAGTCSAEVAGKSIILMIGDGMGFKHVEITKSYVGSTLTMETLPVKVGCTTFMRGGSYNSSLAWSDFNYVKSGYTDSGAAGTTLATGIKTASGRIAVNHDATARLKAMTEHVRDRGWSCGVISSVPFSHATPAAFGAHNNSRNNATAIAREMITTYGDGTGAWGNTPTVDVIISGGHPNYASGWISSTEYNALKNATTGQGWTFVERKTGVNGTTSLLNAASGATKLFGLYGGSDRCLPYRLADGSGRNYENPTLVDMTVAALNVLSKKPTGRFLMVEGGSIDWACEDNNINRLIGEMIDFDQSVAAVVNWVNTNDPTWSNTLLIVTADHETGYITRGSGIFPNVALANSGTGVVPTPGVHFAWNSGGHTNSLVPVYAKGAGSQLLNQYATAYDAGYGIYYLDNTDIFRVMQNALSDTSPPSVPASVQASAQSASSIQVTWTASTDNVGVSGYKVFRNGNLAGTAGAPTYLDSGLQPNTAYSYTVSAFDGAGNQSAQSGPPAVGTTLADTSAPSVPTAVSAVALAPTEVQITWTASTDNIGVTGYRIFRNGAEIDTSSVASYQDYTVTSGESYAYTVSAYDAASNESAQSSPPAIVTTPDNVPPSVPANVSATTLSAIAIALAWTASTDNVGVEGYKIFRNSQLIDATDNISYTDIGVSPATEYSYTVSAYDAANNESAQSSPPAVATTEVGISISMAKLLGDTSAVTLVSKIVSAVFDDCLYVKERDSHVGIRVIPTTMPMGVMAGHVVDVDGTILTSALTDERYVDGMVTIK